MNVYIDHNILYNYSMPAMPAVTDHYNIGFLSPANIKSDYSTVIISFNIYLNVGAELYSFSIYPSFKSICSDGLSGFTPI